MPDFSFLSFKKDRPFPNTSQAPQNVSQPIPQQYPAADVANQPIMIEGKHADEWLQMSALDLGNMGTFKLAKAVHWANLILSGRMHQATQISLADPDSEAETFTRQLLTGKFPLRPKDLMYLTPDQLRLSTDITDVDIRAGNLAKSWMAGETTKVFDACDSVEVIQTIAEILRDEDPTQGGAFDNLLNTKEEGLWPTIEQMAQMWMVGDKKRVLLALKTPERSAAFDALLEQMDPGHATGTMDEYLEQRRK